MACTEAGMIEGAGFCFPRRRRLFHCSECFVPRESRKLYLKPGRWAVRAAI